MYYRRTLETPLGSVLLTSDGKALTGLWFTDSVTCGEGLDPVSEEADLPVFDDTEKWLSIYFSGRDPEFRPALLPAGTPFRMQVWQLLMKIPYGTTMSYGQLAAAAERVVSDLRHTVRYDERSQAFAFSESILSDFRDAVRDRDGGQA